MAKKTEEALAEWELDGWTDLMAPARELAQKIQNSSPVRHVTMDRWKAILAEHKDAVRFKKTHPL